MKLDVQVLRYMEAEEFRLLHGVEQGMRNHEYVPKHLIAQRESRARLGILWPQRPTPRTRRGRGRPLAWRAR